VGDIHGCSVALATVIEAIQPTLLDTFVFVGGFIDHKGKSTSVQELSKNLLHFLRTGSTAGQYHAAVLNSQAPRMERSNWTKTSCSATAIPILLGNSGHPDSTCDCSTAIRVQRQRLIARGQQVEKVI